MAKETFLTARNKESIEINYQNKTYIIVPHNALLALLRSDGNDLLKDLEDILGDD